MMDRRATEDRRKGQPVTVDKTVDARGAYTPEPLMKLIETIEAEPIGSTIEVLASVREPTEEIPFWAAKMGHQHLGTEEMKGYWKILIRKGQKESPE